MKKIILSIIFLFAICALYAQQPTYDSSFPYKVLPDVFPGTIRLTWEGDLSSKMLDGAHKFIEEKINEAISNRSKLWQRDFTSTQAYENSIEANRKRFMKFIGVADKNNPAPSHNVGLPEIVPSVYMQKIAVNNDEEMIAETSKYRVYQVRWPALYRVYGEGLLLIPKGKPVANIIAIPDADQTPEQLAGLIQGIPPASQFARQLAENGFEVLIPTLISRTLLFPGQQEQQTYRELLYRQAYHMGRHIIGYEVQKVLAAVDWFQQNDKDGNIGVAGYSKVD